jgi:8-oxo-dGTP pyrophosphatase MutT (NUDIX family)
MVVPTWNTLFELPGGEVHSSESIQAAATRECYEETGYRVRISAKTSFYTSEEWFYSWPKKTFYHSLIYIYKATLVNTKQNHKVINTKDGNEISRIIWIDLDDCTVSNTHRIAYPAIKLLQENK